MDERFPHCSRSPTFWYGDGNVILNVHSTLFRVHSVTLQAHCVGLQETGDTYQAKPSVNECIVIHLADDADDDWENFLMYMYHPERMNPTIPDIPAHKLCSLLRLSQKYRDDDLFTACVRRLQSELPTTIEMFDEVHPARKRRAPLELGGTSLTAPAENLITIINIALELNIECILPCAYYLILSRLPLENIATGVPSSRDGQRIRLTHAAQEAILTGLDTAFCRMIFSATRYTDASPSLGGVQWKPWCAPDEDTWQNDVDEHMGYEFTDRTASSDTASKCKNAFGEIKPRILRYFSHPRGRELFLARCATGERFDTLFAGLCDRCTQCEWRFREAGRRSFWKGLPGMFAIGRNRRGADGNFVGMSKTWQQLTNYVV